MLKNDIELINLKDSEDIVIGAVRSTLTLMGNITI
jgi:hypothetical protein